MAASISIVTVATSPAASQKQPPSSHRLPTVSASEALQELQTAGPEKISTTLPGLDAVLSGAIAEPTGGLERGKTNGASPLIISRLESALDRQTGATNDTGATSSNVGEYKKHFIHHRLPTLSHLLALILHPRPDFPSPGTTLLVIEEFHTLVDLDYPRVLFASSGKTQQQKWQAGRRYAVLGTLIAGLNKLAVLNNLAIAVTTGCASRVRTDSGLGSALVPGVGGGEWEGGVWNRLVIFRDFGCRFVGVQKSGGRILISREQIGESGKVVCFTIDAHGALRQKGPAGSFAPEDLCRKVTRSPTKSRKRAIDEVADSEGEQSDEYGWAETDEDALTADGPGDEVMEPLPADTAGV
ncbi:hypothetical protein LTR35_000288 [Friedmanniomyces endolithicus]|uniref:DNA recombination and repair protein Rad51-like C-terminal domain-containing protein n=1 Tax=Friedmanniomyces endolithicus TaxID=329885 RepID=A0AAN6FVD0_9PEZI|nr:hypothetical protein LTS00_011126 [Friedmanniomyces endolithicus]KAK0293682.1 hypothetical protein LTR35_000288 [Friedmanniomyces endolithicus]KAK0324197.1 hypothetical protein LTR82_004635 [Friedmanniomyces endolithicus]KAK0992988.1 hypothetical protein LTR54_011310 [Friedmanniomyces endolithicus]